MLINSEMQVIAFSPPLSCEMLTGFFPGGRAMISIPASRTSTFTVCHSSTVTMLPSSLVTSRRTFSCTSVSRKMSAVFIPIALFSSWKGTTRPFTVRKSLYAVANAICPERPVERTMCPVAGSTSSSMVRPPSSATSIAFGPAARSEVRLSASSFGSASRAACNRIAASSIAFDSRPLFVPFPFSSTRTSLLFSG